MINFENTDDKEIENVDKHQPYGDDFNPYQKTDSDEVEPGVTNAKDLGLEDDHSGVVKEGKDPRGNGGDDPSGGPGSV